MIFGDTPVIELDVLGVNFSFMCHQAGGVYRCIEGDPYENSNVWLLNGRWVGVVIGKELRDELLKLMEPKLNEWEEQWEDHYKMAMERIKEKKKRGLV